MKNVRLLRAVTSVLLRNILQKTLLITGGVLGIAVLVLCILGSTVDAWWLVGLALVIPICLVVGLVGGMLWFTSGKLAPHRLTRANRKQITSFVEKILGVVERVRMPYPVLIALVAKDVLRGKESSYLKHIIDDSRGLRDEFRELQNIVE